jgi:hypothetical protein
VNYPVDFGGNRASQSTLGAREANPFAGEAVLPLSMASRWRSIMKRAVLSLMTAAALPLAACATQGEDNTLASAGTGAAVGAAGGAGVAALAGGDLLTGAAIGAAVGGLAGAVWADRNNDGRADGYVYNGQYYEGSPSGSYQQASTTRCGPSVAGSAVTGAGVGAAAGAGAGALIGGLGVLEGAAIGAAVGGIAGAVWADSNNDGCVDGYVREGQYYAGSPVVQPTNVAYTGERG